MLYYFVCSFRCFRNLLIYDSCSGIYCKFQWNQQTTIYQSRKDNKLFVSFIKKLFKKYWFSFTKCENTTNFSENQRIFSYQSRKYYNFVHIFSFRLFCTVFLLETATHKQLFSLLVSPRKPPWDCAALKPLSSFVVNVSVSRLVNRQIPEFAARESDRDGCMGCVSLTFGWDGWFSEH